MKRRRMMMLAILLMFVGSILADNLMVSNIGLKAGEKKAVAINLNNSSKNYVAFQFDVVLPEGITIAKNDMGKLMASLNANRIDDHTLNVQDLGSGSYRFLCFSMSNAEFYGTSGVLVNMTLQADGNISAGKKDGVIKSQVFTETDGNQVKWDDMSFSISVNDGGSSVTSNLGISDIELKAGNTQEMAINLNNGTKNYVAFQFDIVLPEGITIAKNDKGKLMASLNTDRIDDHTLNVQDLGSGNYRFLCFSMTNAEFYGTSGPLVNLTLQASENLSSGERTATIKNQVFTEVSSDQVKWDDLSFKITTPIPVVPKITADNKSRMYGDENPVLTYTTNETLNGEPELVTTATKISPVGEYEIVVRKGTLKGDFIANNGILTISKAPLTITAKSYTMKQGDALPAFDVTYSGFKNDENKEVLTKQPTFSCEATSATAPGTYDIVVSNTEADNYDISYVKGTLTIIEADPVKVTAKSYTREYGNDNPTFEYSVEGASLEGTPEIICEATTTSPVGEYPIIIKKGRIKNYNDTYVNGVLTITKAPLTVSVGNYTKKQGEANPEFALSYSGFKNNETESVLKKKPTATTTATESSAPGEYNIVVSGGEAENYTLSYKDGKLTVVKADAIVITAKSYTREYGEANPTFEYSVEGASLEGTPEIICEATATSPVGEYPIIIKKGSVKNYNDTYINGVLTITKAPLTISVGNYEKKQYDPMPEFMVSYEGFKNNETKDVLTKQPTVSCVANEDSAPGEYAIRVTGAESQNYEIQFVSGKLIVTDPPSYTLTYIVDGEEYKSFTVKYRDAIIPLAVPSKEGYTFSGWSEIPATMPAKDVVVTGTFSVNSYTLTYMVDGEVYKTSSVVYGTTITPEATPTKEGYTFSGWSEIPATMPEKNVVVTGSFTINKYKLTYIVGGVEYKSYEINYASAITPEAAPTKEGYTFSGWSEIPKNMPAKDVVVTGKFSINSYTMTYMVDGEVYKTSTIVYGTPITPEEEPEKKGYTFSGWSEVPATMPAMDVVIKGSFTINKYKLTYMVDGVEYKSYEINYSATITPEATPIKEGYTFSGWSEIPETMPANDVTVTGTFSINSYTLTYMVDGEVYKTSTVAYGTILTPETTPEKEGYTFSGWSEIPETMPANDVVVTGTFTVNSYIVRFMYRDEVLYTEEVNYGEPIPLPELYDDYGLLIKWLDVPETMPAHDIVILVDETDVVLNLQGEKKDDIKIYDLNGHRLASPQKGINIIRMSDGTSHKVLIK